MDEAEDGVGPRGDVVGQLHRVAGVVLGQRPAVEEALAAVELGLGPGQAGGGASGQRQRGDARVEVAGQGR